MASKQKINRLLAIGPLPPPPSGSNVSFQLFCEHLTEYTRVSKLTIIDSSPKRIKSNTSILTVANLCQALRICLQFWRQALMSDCIIIFGSNQFLLSLTPLLVISARILRKPCFIRSFGGSLDQFSRSLHPILRHILHWGFASSNGLLVETKLLKRYFTERLPDKVHHVTAYRPLSSASLLDKSTSINKDENVRLRLVFISWVRVEKGVRDLLNALQLLSLEEQAQVRCEIFGPIVEDYADEFDAELERTVSATYGGVLENAQVLETMQNHDVLVFPTYYQGEGYPGIIVEAMAVGLAVITTDYRSLPDMIDDGINGILVPPCDPHAISEAIRLLVSNKEKLREISSENRMRKYQYDIRTVLPQMLMYMEEHM